MADHDFLTLTGIFGSIDTAIGTIALVILFWKTIKQLEETVKLSKIEANYRFRPWVGPSSSIEFLSNKNGLEQFTITIRTYGELPAGTVIAKYFMKNALPTRDMLKSNETTSFNLGPLLPNMEKHYWFFIDSNLIQKTKADNVKIFVMLYFQYEHLGGNSGYGLISRYDAPSKSFVHVDMWID